MKKLLMLSILVTGFSFATFASKCTGTKNGIIITVECSCTSAEACVKVAQAFSNIK